jgi:hypothetical protein
MATDEKTPQAFDLASITQTDTYTLTLQHPLTGDDLTATVELSGQDSAAFKKQSLAIQNKKADWQRRNRGKDIPADMTDTLFKQQIAACVVSINNLAYKGTPVTDAAEAFERYPWIFEQCYTAVLDRANFIKG